MNTTGLDESPALSKVSNSTLNEYALIERCQAGDIAAWNVLGQRYGSLIYRYAYGLCHNYDDANDIVGQVLLQLCQRLHTYRRQSSFVPWLHTMIRNVFFDHFVRPAHRRNVSLNACRMDGDEVCAESRLAGMSHSPDVIYLKQERTRLLARMVQELPINYRQAMSMYYTEGKSYEEIAATIGISLGTVKSRLHRARALLRNRIETSTWL